MGGIMKVLRCPIEAQEIKVDGLTRGICVIPNGSQILNVLSEPPDNVVSMFVLAPDLGRPYGPDDCFALEFAVAYPGEHVSPDDYIYRGPVRGPSGVMFIFEKKSKNKIVLPGRSLN